MKVISGGQSGADLIGIRWAKSKGINTEINVHKGFKPLYDELPADVNVVSVSEGCSGLIARRRWNIRHSDLTLIFTNGDIIYTKGSLSTHNDILNPKLNLDRTCYWIRLDQRGNIEFPELKWSMTINITGERIIDKEQDMVWYLDEMWRRFIEDGK